MNPIMVEHVFVTTLESTEALPLVGEVLRSSGFERDGGQQMDATRPDWTIVTFRRGVANPAKARSYAEYPQEVRLEWDRGRISLALSLDPGRANGAYRQMCAQNLLGRANLLEELTTGRRSAGEVLGQWSQGDGANVAVVTGASLGGWGMGGAGGGEGEVGLFGSAWFWGCVVLCAGMGGTAINMPHFNFMTRAIVAGVGFASAVAWVVVGLLWPRMSVKHLRSGAICTVFVCWLGLLMTGVVTKTIAHESGDIPMAEDSSGGAGRVPGVSRGDEQSQRREERRVEQAAPAPAPRTLDTALADLGSSDRDKQRDAARWIADAKGIAGSDGARICAGVGPLIAVEDPFARAEYVRLFCRYAGGGQASKLAGCLEYSERYSDCWAPALEALLRCDPAAAGKAARAQISKRRFEEVVTHTLEAVADGSGPSKGEARKILDGLTTELRLAKLGRGEGVDKIRTVEEAVGSLEGCKGHYQKQGALYLLETPLTAAQIAQTHNVLRKYLVVDDREVLVAVFKAFTKYATKEDVKDLIPLSYAGMDRGYLRGPAISAICRVDPVAGRNVIESVANDMMCRSDVFNTLTRAGASSEPAFVEFLKSTEKNVQRDAIHALGQVGTSKAIPALQGLLDSIAVSKDLGVTSYRREIQSAMDDIRRREKVLKGVP